MEQDDQRQIAIRFIETIRKLRYSGQNQIYQELSRGEFFGLMAVSHLQIQQAVSEVRVAALVQELRLSPQATSKLLRTLETKGYILRKTDQNDRRNTLVSMTEQGKALHQDACRSIEEYCTIVTERMGETDMREFIRLSEKCAVLMEETAEEMYQKEANSCGTTGNKTKKVDSI